MTDQREYLVAFDDDGDDKFAITERNALRALLAEARGTLFWLVEVSRSCRTLPEKVHFRSVGLWYLEIQLYWYLNKFNYK